MSESKWAPVHRDTLDKASLVMSFLQGDGIRVKMVPDVTSPPLQSPGAHTVKSRYTRHVVLVLEEDLPRARELVRDYLDEERD